MRNHAQRSGEIVAVTIDGFVAGAHTNVGAFGKPGQRELRIGIAVKRYCGSSHSQITAAAGLQAGGGKAAGAQ